MDLISYTLEDLKSHQFQAFSGNKEVAPLSPLRLQSYLKNLLFGILRRLLPQASWKP